MNRNLLILGGIGLIGGVVALILRRRGESDMIARSQFVQVEQPKAEPAQVEQPKVQSVVSITPQHPRSSESLISPTPKVQFKVQTKAAPRASVEQPKAAPTPQSTAAKTNKQYSVK